MVEGVEVSLSLLLGRLGKHMMMIIMRMIMTMMMKMMIMIMIIIMSLNMKMNLRNICKEMLIAIAIILLTTRDFSSR